MDGNNRIVPQRKTIKLAEIVKC